MSICLALSCSICRSNAACAPLAEINLSFHSCQLVSSLDHGLSFFLETIHLCLCGAYEVCIVLFINLGGNALGLLLLSWADNSCWFANASAPDA